MKNENIMEQKNDFNNKKILYTLSFLCLLCLFSNIFQKYDFYLTKDLYFY